MNKRNAFLRTASGLLALLMTGSVLFSCGSDDKASTDATGKADTAATSEAVTEDGIEYVADSLPDNLDFLRAGGRVSNVASLASRILGIHPCIEILEGKLMATKKYRGKMVKVASQLIHEYAEKYNMDRSCLWLVYTIGLSDEVKAAVKQAAAECGFAELRWIQAHGVITTHGGPAAFGMAGLSK